MNAVLIVKEIRNKMQHEDILMHVNFCYNLGS